MALNREVRRLLRQQNCTISGRQLRGVGFSRAAVRARLARGTLVRIFQDTYVAGDPELLPLAREAAALLSLGPASVLSHRSAAAIWGLARPDPLMIDVTVIGRRPRPRTGVRIHRVTRLYPVEITTTHNLRVTVPSRALIEFASQASSSELEEAFGEARARRLITEAKLKQALRLAPANHPGAAVIRRRLHADPGSTYTRSKAERTVRRLLRAADLPQPLINAPLHGCTADFLWPEARLILEIDGYDTHGDRRAFERDRRRDQVLVAAGYTVIRVTWQQLLEEPYAVIARIAQALARRVA